MQDGARPGEPLGPPVLRALVDAARGAELTFGQTSAIVQYRRPGGLDHQVFERGELVAWERGEVAFPDIILESHADAPLAPAAGDGEDPVAAASRWRIRAGRPIDGPAAPMLLAPLDLLSADWSGLAPVPNADLVWCSTAAATPFGDLSVTWTIVGGRLGSIIPGREDAELWVRAPWWRWASERAGLIPATQILAEGGDVEGDLDALLMIAGLLDLPDWQAARKLEPGLYGAMARLVDLGSNGGFAGVNRLAGHDA